MVMKRGPRAILRWHGAGRDAEEYIETEACMATCGTLARYVDPISVFNPGFVYDLTVMAGLCLC